jgi:hypothetical protein
VCSTVLVCYIYLYSYVGVVGFCMKLYSYVILVINKKAGG